jgi:hypothetical protein
MGEVFPPGGEAHCVCLGGAVVVKASDTFTADVMHNTITILTSARRRLCFLRWMDVL